MTTAPLAARIDVDPPFKPFGDADCETEVKLLKDRYCDYFLGTAPFNLQSVREDSYLIIGRRGSGKTALSRYFGFQKHVPAGTCIDVDEPAVFQKILGEIARHDGEAREIAIPRLVRMWELVFWSVIFRELKDLHPAIATACFLGHTPSSVSTFIRDVIKHLLSFLTRDQGGAVAQGLEDLIADERIRKARDLVLEHSRRSPIFVAVDTLEQYNVRDDAMMRATAALVQCAAAFNIDYASRGVHLKVFMSGEVFPHLKEGVILNPLKSVRNPLYLLWRPKDLLRLLCWRYYKFLEDRALLPPRTPDIDWESHRDVLERMWQPFFGEHLTNGRGLQERTFPYVLRHTQMRPRQLILLCNGIARRSRDNGSLPRIRGEDVVAALRAGEGELASEVINSYVSLYPRVGQIVDALMGIDMMFEGRELDRRAKHSSSQWPKGEYSPSNFRQLVAELGIVGRVRTRDDQAGFVAADFEYASSERLPLGVHDSCVVHPMFFERLKVKTAPYRVYPFPDHPDFRGLNGHGSEVGAG
jgi:hypothetical protein